MAIYVGTTPSQAPDVLKLIHAELEKVMEHGLTTEELERAKGHVQGSLALSLEDSDSLMTRLGRTELTGIEHLSVDEMVRQDRGRHRGRHPGGRARRLLGPVRARSRRALRP